MSDSVQMTENWWNSAAELVDRFEFESGAADDFPKLLENLVRDLRDLTHADSVSLHKVLSDTDVPLAHAGDRRGTPNDVAKFARPSHTKTEPRVVAWTNRETIQAIERIDENLSLRLVCEFPQAVPETDCQPIQEIVLTLIRSISNTFVRREYCGLRATLAESDLRDEFVSDLYDGKSRREAFAKIAQTVARIVNVDRALIFEVTGDVARLTASSTQPNVDRRAIQTRLAQDFVSAVAASSPSHGVFNAIVGSPEESTKLPADSDARGQLETYLSETGVRSLRLEFFQSDQTSRDRQFAILFERFRIADKNDTAVQPIKTLGTLRGSVGASLMRGSRLDELQWGTVSRFITTLGRSTRLRWILGIAAAIVVALCLVPKRLMIPAAGHLVPATQKQHFAPVNATVDAVFVSNNQRVSKGEKLIQLRSAALDQQQEQLESALATAQTRLVAAERYRSGGQIRAADQARDPSMIFDEQVLRTEVDGLKKQLKLMAEYQASLLIVSEIDGRIDSPDLRETLTGRPVTHGQRLVSVVDDESGQWKLQLNVLDRESDYVRAALDDNHPAVTFRVRSRPESRFSATLTELSETAELDRFGNTIVRSVVRLEGGDSYFSGATVNAHIDCGYRPIGFVWFRSVIQWSRSRGWF